MNSTTYYVTGANGWLGVNLVEKLIEGHADHPDLSEKKANKIICFIYPNTDTTNLKRFEDKIELRYGDVRNKQDCETFLQGYREGCLIHLAGIIHPKRSKEFDEINYKGTQNIIEAAIKVGLKKAVVMSSNSPIGCNPHNDHLFDEDSPYNPYMGYGQSKKKMEKYIFSLDPSVINITMIRAPWFYGPNQPERQTLFFKMVRDGGAPIVGSGNNNRSMSYVDNLTQGIMLSVLKDFSQQKVFWISDESPYTMNQVIDTIEDLLENEFKIKCKRKRLKLPGLASDVAQVVDWTLQKIGLYHQKLHVLSEMNKTIANTTLKAQAELGYTPKVSLHEGMKRSIKWCIDKGYL